MKSHFSESAHGAVHRADNAAAHVFDLLGSGRVELGEKINWHADFISGRVWPKSVYSRIRLVYPDDSSDVKIPWELSRLQFLADIGRAHVMTGDDSYKRELFRLLRDWWESNPVEIGINWACSMEVAIRAINIIWGLHFFEYYVPDTVFILEAIRSLYYHALHIEKNIELISDGANSNHLVSNYLGLYYIGLLFPEFDRSAHWFSRGAAGLESEIRAQVLPDGVDYEGSTSYHRLVLEMFLSAYILGQANDRLFSDEYRERLQKMVAFSEAITGNTGRAPLVGDNDDGHVVKLASDEPADQRPLIDIGHKLLELVPPTWLSPTEERLWYLGPGSLAKNKKTRRQSQSRIFEFSKYAVIRNDKFHLLFNAFDIPPRNLGGHKHNDLLSFTLEIDGIPYLIDPGTFCYSADFKKRNLSRSTGYHNTVRIDHQEQNRFLPGRLFFLSPDSRSSLRLWNVADDRITVAASHSGYGRLGDRVTHMRTISASMKDLSVVVIDEFEGRNDMMHKFACSFLTPYYEIERDGDFALTIRAGRRPAIRIAHSQNGFAATDIDRIEYFPRYGVARPGFRVEFLFQGHLPFKIATTITGAAAISSSALSGHIDNADTFRDRIG